MAPEPSLKSQIHLLRHEIADRTAEIQRLETLARGVRSSFMGTPSTPRITSKHSSSTPLSLSTSPNGDGDENKLSARSPSTTRMINTLQKEMDALKGSSQAARAAADAERASREAIQRKCEKLEQMLEILRQENENMNGMLTRKERIMKEDLEHRKQLESQLSLLNTEKSNLHSQITQIQSRLSIVEENLRQETLLREKADTEYAALRSQVNTSSERSREDLQALRAGIQSLKKGRKEDARTMQIMASEIDRLAVGFEKEKDNARELEKELVRIREKQGDQFERALKLIRKEVERMGLVEQENVVRTGEALAELKALNNKIRAVET